MSKQYPGGLITKTPVVPNSISAPGIWSLSDQAEAQASNTWPFTRDPQFNYVTMLLHGDGAAGAVATGAGAGTSTTVTNFNADASTNNFNVTINGDARSNNFTPYQGNGYYSNSFNASALILPASSALNAGTGNFTIEAWILPTSGGYLTGTTGGVMVFAPDCGDGFIRLGRENVAFDVEVNAGVVKNRWQHVAISRSGTTVYVFLDGSLKGTGTSSQSYTLSEAWVGDGGTSFIGYASNLRFVVGTALYTSSFTPSTTPLTAISGTALLTCQSNRFIDNSTNAFTITTTNSPLVASAQPFTLPSSVATYGSGYFDGTTDYLTTPMSTPLTLGAGDFTIECWLYGTFVGEQRPLSCLEATLDYYIYAVYLSGTELRFYAGDGTSYAIQMTAAGAMKPGAWNHVAVVRSGSTATMYVNGVSVATDASASVTLPAAGTPLWLGGEAYGGGYNFFNGYMTDARIVKGTAVYTTTFTPPTAPLTAITNTSLLTTQYNGGGNNSGFKDSSQNNFVITRNGNTTQGAFAPFGADWSNYFNGSTAYLQVANNAAFDFGSGDWTIEFWMYGVTQALGNLQPIINKGTDFGSIYAPYDIVQSGLDIQLYLNGTSSGWNIASGVVIGTITLGQWTHFAVTRSGTTFRAFKNGVQTWTTTNSQAMWVSTYPFRLAATSNAGSFYNGYLSNVRLVKGTAVYTSNFTPSVTPLTAITNTSLLTAQSNRFIDNSTNAFTVTATGSPSVQGFSPFAPLTVYNPATYGGSGYFDGTGDRLNVNGTNSALAFGSGNFTIEMFFYISAFTNTYTALYDGRPVSTNGAYPNISITSGRLYYYVSSAERIATANSTIVTGQWYHVAVSRSGTSTKMFLNGTQVGSTYTDTTTYLNGANRPTIGAEGFNSSPSDVVNGYISNARTLTGTALYTTTFTPPTAPLTAVANTQLLTNFTNAGVFDNAMINNLESVGNATISTNVVKYGRASMLFDGTGDYLKMPATNLNVGFNTSDFTVELWIYFNSVSGVQKIYDNYNGNNNANAALVLNNPTAGRMQWYSGQTQVLQTTTTFTTGAWYHVAVSRSSGTSKIFVNGTQEASATDSNNYVVGNANVAIGAEISTALYSVNGYIDDFRITYGYARYTASFTAPTSAFPNG